MEYVKRIFVVVFAILTLNLFLPNMALSQQQFATADVPKHEPQSWGTPEENIPTVKKKTSGWTYLILIALIGGIAAAASSGDSGGGSSGGGDGGDTGGYTGTW